MKEEEKIILTDFCSSRSLCSVFCIAILICSLALLVSFNDCFVASLPLIYFSLNLGTYSFQNGCNINRSNVGKPTLHASFDKIDSNKSSAHFPELKEEEEKGVKKKQFKTNIVNVNNEQ